MKAIYFNKILLYTVFLLLILSCGQKQAVKEENPVFEETGTNEIITGEEKADIETNQIFTTEETPEISNKIRVLILPFNNKADQSVYPNAKIVNTILQNELYTFLYIVPSFDVPEKSELSAMDSGFLNRKDATAGEIYSNYRADIIIFGDYDLHGKKSDPEAQINLNIWNRATGKIDSRKYKTPIDADIFDAVDSILSSIISLTLNEDLKVAYLNFGNFKIGNGSYQLLINDILAAKITNDSFRLNLKILPNAMYSVRLRNLADKRNVINTKVVLKPGETTNISHSAIGNIRCSINNKIPGDEFHIFLDENEMPLNEIQSNIPAGREHQIKVVDKNKTNYTGSFYLSDGEFKAIILPKEKMVFYDFTGNYAIPFSSYSSKKSSVEMLSHTNSIKEGKKSFPVDFNVNSKGYAGIHLSLASFYNKMDWSGMNTFKIWIYGTQTHISYFIQLTDKGNEYYWYWLKDDWKGWKLISIPIDSFKFRTPYQPKNAKINHIIDYSLTGFDIEMDSFEKPDSSGNLRLTVGEMDVTKE